MTTLTFNPPAPNIKLAALFALIGAFMYALSGVFAKLIGSQLPTTMIVFVRFSVNMILLFPFFLTDPQLLKVEKPMRFICRSVAAILSVACMFYTLKFLSLANALLLNNTNALFVPIIAYLVSGSKTPLRLWVTIAIGFVGVIFILQPDKEILDIAAFIGLASGFFSGLSLVQLRKLAKESSTQQILFYYIVTGIVITGVLLPFVWETPDAQTLLYLLGVGAAGAVFQVFIVLSFTYAPLRIMSSVMFLSVLVGALFDWLIWNNLPSLATLIGMSIIVTSSLITILIGQRALAR